jgi:hypothetical protein
VRFHFTFVTSILYLFQILLSQGDLRTIFSILNENLQEGEAATKPEPSPSPTVNWADSKQIQEHCITSVTEFRDLMFYKLSVTF